jgi:hypothetical protein
MYLQTIIVLPRRRLLVSICTFLSHLFFVHNRTFHVLFIRVKVYNVFFIRSTVNFLGTPVLDEKP